LVQPGLLLLVLDEVLGEMVWNVQGKLRVISAFGHDIKAVRWDGGIFDL
jgi:hypothetical protein